MGFTGSDPINPGSAQKLMDGLLAEQADLLDNVLDAIIATDAEYQITYWNRGAEELYGWTRDEALGKNSVDLLRSSVPVEVRAAVFRQLQATGMYRGEVTHHLKDGREVIVDTQARLRRGPSGEVTGYVFANRDVTASKAADQKNRQLLLENQRQQGLLDAIFDADPSGLAVVAGPQLTFAYVNPTYRYICPIPGQELAGLPYDQVWQGDENVSFIAQIRETITSGRPFQADGFERHFPDGSWRYFNIQVRRITWEDQPAALIILWDVTDRKRAEHELMASEQYWRTIVDNTYDWEYWVDPKGKLLYNARSCERITGRPISEWKNGISLLKEICHQEDRRKLEEHFRIEKAASGPGAITFRILTPEGQVRWVDHVCQPVMSPQGKYLGTRVSNRNVSSSKENEQLLSYHSALLDNLSDAVIASDQEFCLTAWNKAAEKLYGWKAEEVLGKPGLDIIRTEFPERDKEAMLKAISTEGRYYGEATQMTRDGTRFPVDVRSIVLRDQAGKVTGYLSVNRDISARKQDQEAVLESMARIEVQRRLLEHREQERIQIARDLHDVNIQELTAISILLYEIIMEDLPGEVKERLSDVADLIKAQIQDLRSYASELRPPIMASFGVGKAIRAHVDNYQAKHPELTIQFEDNQVGGLLPEDIRLALFRIYQEALANIAKHTKATEIHIRLIKTEAEAFLEIRDNGQGFEVPNDWLDLARHGHLGLVGMRERAEAVGGVLTPFSTPGEGTRICVVVPLKSVETSSQNST